MSYYLGTGLPGALRFGVKDAFRKSVYAFLPVHAVITPLAAQAANVVALVATPAAGPLTLSAGAGATAVTLGGVVYVKPDVARGLTLTSSGADTGKTALVTGLNVDGQPQTELVALGAAAVRTKKTFSAVASITLSAAAAANFEVGFADLFPLPVAVDNAAQVIGVSWADVLARDTGTLTYADRTAPATATTGDIRGTYAPSTASNGANRLGLTVAANSLGYSEREVAVALGGVQPA